MKPFATRRRGEMMKTAGIERRLASLERGEAGPYRYVLFWAGELDEEEGAGIITEGGRVIQLRWADDYSPERYV